MLSSVKYPMFYSNDIGKIFKHTKKVYTWEFKYNCHIKIQLLDSRITGKKRVLLNDKEVYSVQHFGLFTYTFIYSQLNFSIVQLTKTQYELYIDREAFSKILEQSRDNNNEGIIVSKEVEFDDIDGKEGLVKIVRHDYEENNLWDFDIDFTSQSPKSISNKEITSFNTSRSKIQKKSYSDNNLMFDL
jgi:hypothetical protein